MIRVSLFLFFVGVLFLPEQAFSMTTRIPHSFLSRLREAHKVKWTRGRTPLQISADFEATWKVVKKGSPTLIPENTIVYTRKRIPISTSEGEQRYLLKYKMFSPSHAPLSARDVIRKTIKPCASSKTCGDLEVRVIIKNGSQVMAFRLKRHAQSPLGVAQYRRDLVHFKFYPTGKLGQPPTLLERLNTTKDAMQIIDQNTPLGYQPPFRMFEDARFIEETWGIARR